MGKKIISEKFDIRSIYDITWVFYSENGYDPSKVTKIQDDPFDFIKNKPKGGLWASPINSEWGWKDWCNSEEFRLDHLKVPFMFKISKNARIYVIDDFDDLKKISIKRNSLGFFNIDYKLLEIIGFDGIFVTKNAAFTLREVPRPYMSLGLWDCESICIFNKDIVIPINNENNVNEIKENRNMNKKQTIRLNESQLNNIVKRVVKESVKKLIKESSISPQEAAYQLNVMLGTIHDEMSHQNGNVPSLEEINELYELSSIIYGYFENGN